MEESEEEREWNHALNVLRTVFGARFPGADERSLRQAVTGVLLLQTIPENEILTEAMRHLVDELHRRGLPVLPRALPTLAPESGPEPSSEGDGQ